MKGQFSDASPLSANASPAALASADVVMLVGQHCMPTVGEFAFGPDARYIRIDQNAEDIGRNLPIDVGIVSCERAALEALADLAPRMSHDAWIAEIAAARKKLRGPEPGVLQDRARLYRRRAPGGDREGAGRLPLSRLAAARPDDGRLGRLRDRPLRAPRAARLPPGPDHERRLSVRRHRSRRRLRGGRRGRGATRCRARRPRTRGIRSSAPPATPASATPPWRSTPWRSTGCRS